MDRRTVDLYRCHICRQRFNSCEIFSKHCENEHNISMGGAVGSSTNNSTTETTDKTNTSNCFKKLTDVLGIERPLKKTTAVQKIPRETTTDALGLGGANDEESGDRSETQKERTSDVGIDESSSQDSVSYGSTIVLEKRRSSYTCPIQDCRKSFALTSEDTKAQLYCRYINHLEIHEGLKPYVCPFCGFGFDEDIKLLEHATSHTNVSAFECSNCNNTYKSKRALDQHMDNCHFPRKKRRRFNKVQ